MQYHLYPPFFVVHEESNFYDAWEAFCCKLLNLQERTVNITRCSPPDLGIDLYFPDRKTAYQCKSVESGKDGDFSLQAALKSMKAATTSQKDLGWKRYVLCTNVTPSGRAQLKLKAEMPSLLLRPRSFWQHLCQRFPVAVEPNFRLLLDIPEHRHAMNTQLGSDIPILAKRGERQFSIFLFYDTTDHIYRLKVSGSLTVRYLLNALISFFGFPPDGKIRQRSNFAELSHHISLDGKRLTGSNTLQQARIIPGSLITLVTTTNFYFKSKQFQSEHLNLALIPTPQTTEWPDKFKDQLRHRITQIESCLPVITGPLDHKP